MAVGRDRRHGVDALDVLVVEPQVWLNLQTRYDLGRPRTRSATGWKREVTPRAA